MVRACRPASAVRIVTRRLLATIQQLQHGVASASFRRPNRRQILQLCRRTGKLDTQFSRRFFGICATTTTTSERGVGRWSRSNPAAVAAAAVAAATAAGRPPASVQFPWLLHIGRQDSRLSRAGRGAEGRGEGEDRRDGHVYHRCNHPTCLSSLISPPSRADRCP